MNHKNSTTTTSSTAGIKFGGTSDSLLGKTGELWGETTAASGKATKTVTGKVNEALGEGNFGEAIDDVANRLGETASALVEKAGTLRYKLGGKAGTAAEQAGGFFSKNLDHLITFTKRLFGG